MENIINKICRYQNAWYEDKEYEQMLIKEMEEEVWKILYTYLYNEMYNYIIFWIKLWICLFIIYQAMKIIDKIDSKQEEKPLIEFDEDF